MRVHALSSGGIDYLRVRRRTAANAAAVPLSSGLSGFAGLSCLSGFSGLSGTVGFSGAFEVFETFGLLAIFGSDGILTVIRHPRRAAATAARRTSAAMM